MITPNTDTIYVNQNVYLTAPNTIYATALYSVIDANRDNFSQFMAWPKWVKNRSDTEKFLSDSLITHQQDISKTYIILFEDKPVGIIAFNQIDKANKTAYIGYWLDNQAQGKGIITQSTLALTEYYAVNKMIKRFVIKCSVANDKSNRVAKRCGFEHEGILKQAEYLNGTFYDQNLYALISSYL